MLLLVTSTVAVGRPDATVGINSDRQQKIKKQHKLKQLATNNNIWGPTTIS